jgi:hypothetical protein
MRAAEKHKKWRKEAVKQEADKKASCLYSKSIGVEIDDDIVDIVGVRMAQKKKKAKLNSGLCRCGSKTHQRVKHRDCRLNSKTTMDNLSTIPPVAGTPATQMI